MAEERRWEDLPMDCLVNVFAKLGIRDKSLGVSLVCNSWYKASLHRQCWEILDLNELQLNFDFWKFSPKIHKVKCIKVSRILKFALNRSQGSARVLKFSNIHAEFVNLVLVSEQCPALEVLVLPYMYPTDESKKLSSLVSKWKNLQILCMECLPLNFALLVEEISHHCKHFTTLQARDFIDENIVSAIVKWIPKIKQLDLSRSIISKEDLLLILDGCKELVVLDVSFCTGFAVEEEILQKASHIKDFSCLGSTLSFEDGDPDDELLLVEAA